MKTERELGIERGFLYIPGTRVFVTGTRHHGFRGEVVEAPGGWPARAMAVKLDEFEGVLRFYRHNLIPVE